MDTRRPRLGQCASSRVVEVDFDPTTRAQLILGRTTPTIALTGAPAAAAPSPSAAATSPSAAATSTSAAVAAEDASPLDGMPLRLVNCSLRRRAEAHHWWLDWRNASGELQLLQPPSPASDSSSVAAASPSSSGAAASPASAAAHAAPATDTALCVRIGPDRAPRQPDFALAQLAPCLGYRPADADAGAAAAALLQAGGAAPSELPALFGTRVSTASAAASTTASAAAGPEARRRGECGARLDAAELAGARAGGGGGRR